MNVTKATDRIVLSTIIAAKWRYICAVIEQHIVALVGEFSLLLRIRKESREKKTKTLSVKSRNCFGHLPYFYPSRTCDLCRSTSYLKKYINYYKRALVSRYYKEIEIFSFLFSSSSSPFLFYSSYENRRKQSLKVKFSRMLFTLKSICFVSFQYTRKKYYLSRYSARKKWFFSFFLLYFLFFFFSRVSSQVFSSRKKVNFLFFFFSLLYSLFFLSLSPHDAIIAHCRNTRASAVSSFD